MAAAYYWARTEEFLSTPPTTVLGCLAAAHAHATLEIEQRAAWEEEVQILRVALSRIAGTVYLEFEVPRLGSRIDAVLVSGPAVFPIEFKCGEQRFTSAAHNQAWDYALDLKNFHLASHDAAILPVLVATAAASSDDRWQPAHSDGVRPPRRCKPADLAGVVHEALQFAEGPVIDGEAWATSPYQPTPTIIEAARALYSRHSVEAISRNDAGAKNLGVTSVAVEEIIDRTRSCREKAIVFVTGVPGAGETLVGLNVATRRRELGATHAVFLSGNGPLVAVLQEALTRDEMSRLGTSCPGVGERVAFWFGEFAVDRWVADRDQALVRLRYAAMSSSDGDRRYRRVERNCRSIGGSTDPQDEDAHYVRQRRALHSTR